MDITVDWEVVVNQEVVDVTLPLILQNIICLVKSGGSVFTSIVCGSIGTGQGIVQIPTQIWLKKKDSVDGNVNISLYSEMMSYFTGENFSVAVSGSGCKKNVCTDMWLKCYLDTLSDEDLKKVQHKDSSTNFMFRSGERVQPTQ